MAQDDSHEQGGEHSGSDQSQHGAGQITIATTDPAVETAVAHPSDWNLHPDSTLCVETTQVDESSPLYLPGVRTIVIQDHSQKGAGKEHEPPEIVPPQPSIMSSLMMTAAIALVAGLIGAFGYSYMAGPTPGKSSSHQSQSSGGSSSQGGSSSNASSGSKTSSAETGSGGDVDK